MTLPLPLVVIWMNRFFSPDLAFLVPLKILHVYGVSGKCHPKDEDDTITGLKKPQGKQEGELVQCGCNTGQRWKSIGREEGQTRVRRMKKA